MKHSGSFYGLCLLLLNAYLKGAFCSGVFGAGTDEVKSVSVTEGDSVTQHTDITEIQINDLILWMFGPQEDRIAEIYKQKINYLNSERFRDRLQMDSQTGSLTIRNIRSEHTGLYKLQISRSKGTSYKRFNVTVYARLPYPVINRNPSNCSSSSSSESRCSLVCSAVNLSDVTLSWYKGMSVLSSISVSDLSISLSLPLDVEYQDKNTYSCVINNPVRNQTTHLDNIMQLCHTCEAPGQRSSFMTVIAVTLALLAAIAVVGGLMCHSRFKQPGKKVQSREEEVLYTVPAFCNLQNTDIVAADHTVYSTVVT